MTIDDGMKGFGYTNIGRVRDTNQDTFLIDDDLGLWIVADGMGGHAGGEVASQLAVESVHEYMANQIHRNRLSESVDWPVVLQHAVNHANTVIRQHGKAKPALKGMGTTAVLLFWPTRENKEGYVVHVGDSRAYLLREQQLSPLTRDHTLLEERRQIGLLPKTASSNHPLGHVLTRGVGVEKTVEADVSKVDLQKTDEVLLCSDGLNKMMNDEQILEVLREGHDAGGHEKCLALIQEANRLGGKDNTTVVLIQKK